MMESIERLRKMDDGMLVPLGNGQYVPDHSHNDIADQIEAEIAERYMELPVDADGVPWHIGDKFPLAGVDGKKHICTVLGVSEQTCEELGSVRIWQECDVWSHELSCGHEVDTLDMEPPNYCPNCGARVTPKNSETTPKVVSE